jgi:predicted AlkP superfamily pyrophosphatase or phosphodiesterase
MDVYRDVLYYSHEGKSVMLLYLDGFSWDQYSYAVTNGFAPFLKSLPAAEMASSVFEPVTNAGMAAMITGEPPAENGVYSRSERQLKVPSLFKVLEDMGKSSVMIEGNINILDIEIQPILNPDKDESGTTDEEVFASAIENIQKNPDFMLVHFHGIDDRGHDKGALSPDTMEIISKTDEYIKLLLSEWNGAVIITSDHGMHDISGVGDHGSFRYEDLIVPYISADGG